MAVITSAGILAPPGQRAVVAEVPLAAFETLVSDSESLLSLELSGWVRQMTQTVDELQSEQKKAGTPSGDDTAGSNGAAGSGPAPTEPTAQAPTDHTAQPPTDPTAQDAEPPGA